MTNLLKSDLQNVLCIRVDNMGDILMSSPALRALKETFDCKITVLTSTNGALITPFIFEIDETIVTNVPWVKTERSIDEIELAKLVQKLAGYAFDAAIIFTVYSQSPLPAAMLAFLAGISIRVAYCRENPYQLLSHWIPEEEPYQLIRHQVERDLALVEVLGAQSSHKSLSIEYPPSDKLTTLTKIEIVGMEKNKPILLFHPGVSEIKRQFDLETWIQAGKDCLQNGNYQIAITGVRSDQHLTRQLQEGIGFGSYSLAGVLSIGEWIALIDMATVVVSVNTGTVHIASALATPVVVLYALTNPQHTPWQTPSKILYFEVLKNLKSKNAVVNYVSEHLLPKQTIAPTAKDIWEAVNTLLQVEKINK